jgi:hypothetical protein
MKRSRQMLSQDTINSVNFLDHMREQLRDWSLSLFDPVSGGFRCNESIGVNVMSTTDMVWLRYAANDLNPGSPDRDKIVEYLHGKQDPDTGRISHDYGGHSDGHAFWQAVRALRILDAQLPHFPAYMEPMLNPSGLDTWFMSLNWDGFSDERRGNHHEVLGLIPAIVSLADDELTQCLFRNIENQQNKETGTWPRAKTNISRTFAYTALHLATGRMPKMPEAILDKILRMQYENGLWDKDLPSFGSMDSAYLLVRLPGRIGGYRQKDATDSLQKLSAAMRRVFAAGQEALLRDTHRMLAMTHTFGLLQEVFPNEYKSERPYRFDWDKLDLYVCEVIARKQ